jgi:hypothetical protein
MDDFFAIDLERDVNWGDSTYVCKYCCALLAEIAGYVDMGALQDQMNTNEALKRKVHQLKAQLEERDRRLEAIAEGRKALKKTKKRSEKRAAA